MRFASAVSSRSSRRRTPPWASRWATATSAASPCTCKPLAQGGVLLAAGESRTRVFVDGVPLAGDLAISAADLARGVVLELSDRMVLLLHVLDHLTAPGGPRHGLVGDSGGIARVRSDITGVASFDVPVLLRGETGTGKELAARALHEASRRHGGPFVAVNLGAIPPTLVASELFGAARGAYTGSVQPQEGYFRKAHGGTLLLDEVGEATPEVQVMLLRTLETGEVHPVGTQSPQRVDVRVLAATDADLEARVAAGEFRAPLLHRLAGYEIWLRSAARAARRHRPPAPPLPAPRAGGARRGRPTGARASRHSPWLPRRSSPGSPATTGPGNVRQLRNVVRQIAIGSRGLARAEIGPAVERLLRDPAPRATEAPAARESPAALPVERRRPADVSESELIEALQACRWDLQAASERLHISRPSLYALVEANPRLRKAGDLTAAEITLCWEDSGGDIEAMVDRLQVSRKALSRRLRELKLI